MLDSNDFSTYHALEAQLTRRFSNGVSFNLAYTWSKALDTRSFDPTLTVVGTGQRLDRRRYAVRHQQSPPELRAGRFRPPPCVAVEFRRRTAFRQGQALAGQRIQHDQSRASAAGK